MTSSCTVWGYSSATPGGGLSCLIAAEAADEVTEATDAAAAGGKLASATGHEMGVLGGIAATAR
jgi:hypothetical protein